MDSEAISEGCAFRDDARDGSASLLEHLRLRSGVRFGLERFTVIPATTLIDLNASISTARGP